MLSNLDIQNIALIDHLSIDFRRGLNVLSGETGAGKSIIIDSLNFVLGGKASKTLLKQGSDYMKVVATFFAPFSGEVQAQLTSFGFEIEEQIILSRKYQIDGRSDIRINGQSVTLAMLKSISSLLVDIHGQHEHQRLLSDKFHLNIIDGFIKNKNIFENFSNEYQNLKNINSQIAKLSGPDGNQERMLDLLKYQIDEIEAANILPNEDEILSQKKLAMQNFEKIYDGLNSAYSFIDGTGNTVGNVKSASNALANLVRFDETLSSFSERLDGIKYELMDIANSLKSMKDNSTFDKYEFEKIDSRLDIIKTLKRKYGPSLDDVFRFLEQAKTDFENISNSKQKLIKLESEKEKTLDVLFDLANKMHDIRVKTALNFEEKTKSELDMLGMKNSTFKVNFGICPNRENLEKSLSANGYDDVKFMFSANLGQNLKPLSEIISGGEASRFMLALKNILAENDNISLMVFDDIDAGISGEMGFKVACKLANIARAHQVMSVSHLPQICAMADQNLFVQKQILGGNTIVTVKNLNADQTLTEIARLSGGEETNNASISHAKALKERCDKYKNLI